LYQKKLDWASLYVSMEIWILEIYRQTIH
jgi:hypothetical protein